MTATAASSVAGLIPALSGIANPFAASGTPSAPSAPDLSLPLLAWVRRQFFNSPPQINYTPANDTQTAAGLVVGNIDATDPDGDAVTFSYIGQAIRGGTVSVDPTTGNFTYTPTAKMLQYGGFDQFNVTVTDQTPGSPTFHGLIDLIGLVPVIGPVIKGFVAPYTDSVPATITVYVAPTVSQNLIPAGVSGQQLSLDPIAANNDWQSYVLTPSSTTVTAPTVYYVSGDVTNPDGIAGGSGSTTLTYRVGEQAPVIILDYGQVVGGYPQLQVTGSSPNLVWTAFSETAANMSPFGDGAITTALLADSGDPLTFELTPVLGSNILTSNQIQGGYRYEMITLTAPGSITISTAPTIITAPLKSASQYQGSFMSSSDLLNRIWYDGAYTINLDMIAAGTAGFFGPYPLSILGEAAKRDRAIWAGDLLVAAATLHDVFGSFGDALTANNITLMATSPITFAIPGFGPFGPVSASGPMPGVCRGTGSGGCIFYSTTYSMNFVDNVHNYYTITGDTALVQENWALIQRELAYESSLVDSATGLIDVPLLSSLDWSIGLHPGQNTAANVLHYRNLTDAAELATLMGDTSAAAQYSAQAAATKDAINEQLWNQQLGAYDASTTQRGVVVQDANSWAVLYGVASDTQSAQIVQTMNDTLWTAFGIRSADPNASGYSNIVSPYIGSFTLAADYLAGRPDLAMNLLATEWGHMANADPASTTWEKINLPNGDLTTVLNLFGDSASHAWSTGGTTALTSYVAGITATGIAYQQWQVKPYPEGVDWAQGTVPTSYGTISSRWQTGNDAFRLTVEAPSGTSGKVAVPTLGELRVIYQDGVEVWDGTQAVNGATASEVSGYIEFTDVTGSHTWAWAGTARSAITA
jgi:hypothetical protein